MHEIPFDNEPGIEPAQQLLSLDPTRQVTSNVPPPAPLLPSRQAHIPPMIPPTASKTSNPIPQSNLAKPATMRPRSVNTRFKDIKGINIHVHNLKSVSLSRPFKVFLKMMKIKR